MADNVELNKAIGSAEAELKGEKAPVEDKTALAEGEVELEAEPEGDDTPESGEEADGKLSDSEIEEANRLYKALRNPLTSGPIVAALAAQAGLHLTPQSTKTEVKEVKKSIQDRVSEALGDQYKFLAPQLGKAIEAALESVKQDNEASLAEIRQNQIERDVVASYDKLNRETKGESKKLESRMVALSEEIPIGNQSVDVYIRRLYSVATAESQKTSAKATAERIRKNANNSADRLRGTATGADPKLPDKKLGLKESVEFALAELTKGQR